MAGDLRDFCGRSDPVRHPHRHTGIGIKTSCSQLMAISDNAYEAGVRRLESEVAGSHIPKVPLDHICLITIRGEKTADPGQARWAAHAT
jgi:hypothetical protein